MKSAPVHQSRRKAASLNVLWQYGLTGLTLVKGVILVPLYLTHFSLETYGVWLATAGLLAIGGIVEGGLAIVLTHRLAVEHGKACVTEFSRLGGTGGLMLACLASAVGLAVAVLAPYVPVWLGAPAGDVESLRLALLLAGSGTSLLVFQGAFQAALFAWQRTGEAALARGWGQLIEVSVLVVALHYGLGIVSLGLAACIGAICSLAASGFWVLRLWKLGRLPTPSASPSLAAELTKQMLPGFLSRFSSSLLANSDVTILTLVAGPSAAAVYALTDRAFRLSHLLVNPIASSAFAGLSHRVGEMGTAGLRPVLSELTTLSTIASVLTLTIALALNKTFISVWVGPAQFGGVSLSIGLCVASFIAMRTNLLTMVLPGTGEFQRTALVAIVEGLVRLPLAIALLLFVGPVGVPAASIVTALFALGGGYLPALADQMGEKYRTIAVDQSRHGSLVVLSFVVGGVLISTLPVAESWFVFAGQAAIVSVGIGAGLALASREARACLALARGFIHGSFRPSSAS